MTVSLYSFHGHLFSSLYVHDAVLGVRKEKAWSQCSKGTSVPAPPPKDHLHFSISVSHSVYGTWCNFGGQGGHLEDHQKRQKTPVLMDITIYQAIQDIRYNGKHCGCSEEE